MRKGKANAVEADGNGLRRVEMRIRGFICCPSCSLSFFFYSFKYTPLFFSEATPCFLLYISLSFSLFYFLPVVGHDSDPTIMNEVGPRV